MTYLFAMFRSRSWPTRSPSTPIEASNRFIFSSITTLGIVASSAYGSATFWLIRSWPGAAPTGGATGTMPLICGAPMTCACGMAICCWNTKELLPHCMFCFVAFSLPSSAVAMFPKPHSSANSMTCPAGPDSLYSGIEPKPGFCISNTTAQCMHSPQWPPTKPEGSTAGGALCSIACHGWPEGAAVIRNGPGMAPASGRRRGRAQDGGDFARAPGAAP
mmetsp:Transcript_44736/g.135714  ORF Transcript_44736/g.135714 Transcript_44736/m.135714 type:complete len:218 (+) Transcript_44736:641-1294(+)